MDCYIIHYTKLTSRLEYLEKNIFPILRSLSFIKNIVVITDFDKEHPFFKGKNNGRLSCSKKHFESWEYFRKSTDNYCMVLEDDVIVEDHILNAKDEFEKMFNSLKPEYNIVTFGSGLHWRGPSTGFNPKTKGRCTEAYIITKKFLSFHTGEIYSMPIGHYMNKIINNNKDFWYWYEPTIFKQGSQDNTYKSTT